MCKNVEKSLRSDEKFVKISSLIMLKSAKKLAYFTQFLHIFHQILKIFQHFYTFFGQIKEGYFAKIL